MMVYCKKWQSLGKNSLPTNAKLSAEEIAQLEQRIFDLQSRLSDANKQSENRMEA
jgi:hypothetical protein